LAGQRLRRLLDSGLLLSSVVHRAVRRNDEDELRWLAWAIRDEAVAQVAQRGAPDRAAAQEVEGQADALYEAVVDALMPHLAYSDHDAWQYHDARRSLATEARSLDAVAELAVAQAKGDRASITRHRAKVGVTQAPWASMIEHADRDPGWDDPTEHGPVAEAPEAATTGA